MENNVQDIADKINERKSGSRGYKFIQTGAMLLDLAVGGRKGAYGYPSGTFINLWGDKSSGKTFLAKEVIASAYHTYGKKLKWLYDDVERGDSFTADQLMVMYGLPMNEENLCYSSSIEQSFQVITNFVATVKEDEIGIVVVDSWDALTSREMDERADERIKTMNKGKDFDKGSYQMGKQKFASQEYFPQLASKIQDKNVIVIIISQVRDNISGYGEEHTKAGGKAMDFYFHCILKLKTIKKFTRTVNGEVLTYGVMTQVETKKLKSPRSNRKINIFIYFDYGINNILTSLNYLYKLFTPTGEPTANFKAIVWNKSEDAKPINAANVKAWFNELEIMDKFKDSLDKDKPDLKDMLAFIKKEKLGQEFNQRFGQTMDADELSLWIAENALYPELNDRLEQLWEEEWAAVATALPSKYANRKEI